MGQSSENARVRQFRIHVRSDTGHKHIIMAFNISFLSGGPPVSAHLAYRLVCVGGGGSKSKFCCVLTWAA